MAKELTRYLVGTIRLFFVVCCSIASLQHSVVKLKIIGTASFLITSCRKVERGSQQTPYFKILFEAVFGKGLCTNARMLQGCKAFYFCKPFSLSFGSWVNLKVVPLDFEWFSSKIHCEVETKTV